MPKAGHAEYMQRWRKLQRERGARKAHQVGVQEGVEMACKFLRTIIGGRVVTGHEAAIAIEKALSLGQT
jgi:hypothetical protein